MVPSSYFFTNTKSTKSLGEISFMAAEGVEVLLTHSTCRNKAGSDLLKTSSSHAQQCGKLQAGEPKGSPGVGGTWALSSGCTEAKWLHLHVFKKKTLENSLCLPYPSSIILDALPRIQSLVVLTICKNADCNILVMVPHIELRMPVSPKHSLKNKSISEFPCLLAGMVEVIIIFYKGNICFWFHLEPKRRILKTY